LGILEQQKVGNGVGKTAVFWKRGNSLLPKTVVKVVKTNKKPLKSEDLSGFCWSC